MLSFFICFEFMNAAVVSYLPATKHGMGMEFECLNVLTNSADLCRMQLLSGIM